MPKKFGSCAALLGLVLAVASASGCAAISAADEKHLLGKEKGSGKPNLDIGGKLKRSYNNYMGLSPDETAARAVYAEGEKLYQEAKVKEALEKFKVSAARWPDSALEEDSMFMQAECLFFTDQYAKAMEAYQLVVKKYQNTKHLETISSRLFVIGRYWEKESEKYSNPVAPNFTDPKRPLFDTRGNALTCYQSVRLSDPTGPLADDSMMATATAFYTQGRFQDADYYYEQLRKEYPRSEHQAKAHILSVQSKINGYQGPAYEGRGLDTAAKLAKTSLVQFPNELGEERSKLVALQDSVYLEKARREYEMGEYYLRGEHHRAARYYFGYVVENFPDSDYATQARSRLQEIAGRPDQAPNRFEWIAKPFEPIGRKNRM